MAENGWDAVVIGASDPHSSEYPAPRWQQVRWVSGFTGEAGDISGTSVPVYSFLYEALIYNGAYPQPHHESAEVQEHVLNLRTPL